MLEFKTLEFPNTPRGQEEKVRTLQFESAHGWRVVSETIAPGHFKGGDACCLFIICAPCAFLAGHTDGTITVTLQRDMVQGPPGGGEAARGQPAPLRSTTSQGMTAGTWVFSAVMALLLLSMIAGIRC